MARKPRLLLIEPLEHRSLLSATVSIDIPKDLTIQPGEEIVVPVRIDNAAGVRGVDIRINYDTTFLDATVEGVKAGALWPAANTEVVANVDDAAGSIIASVFTPAALGSGSGSLLEIHLTAKPTAPSSGTTQIDLTRVRVNEGEIVPAVEPQPGADATDGLITFQPNTSASLSGVVYADGNGNGQNDPLEGLSGVQVTLVQSGSNQTRQTVTDSSGRYSFSGLTEGSYTVRITQPSWVASGGPTEVSGVQVARGQSVVVQDFRTGGLLPLYIPNRLLATSVQPAGSDRWTAVIQNVTVNPAVQSTMLKTATASTRVASATTAKTATAATTKKTAAVVSATARTSAQRLQAIDAILKSMTAWRRK